jgi:hypothetical protein
MRESFPLCALGVLIITLIFVGCASLQPGADPLVVRVEQGETVAKASFDLVVNVDDSQRAFWITNAPAFHNFVEWLRAPVPLGTNAYPRGIAMIFQVDSAKVAYEADKSSSNALLTAFAALTQAESQATAWQTIVTTKSQ